MAFLALLSVVSVSFYGPGLGGNITLIAIFAAPAAILPAVFLLPLGSL